MLTAALLLSFAACTSPSNEPVPSANESANGVGALPESGASTIDGQTFAPSEESINALLELLQNGDFSAVAGIYTSPRWNSATIEDDGSMYFSTYMDYEGHTYHNVSFAPIYDVARIDDTNVIVWTVEYPPNKFDLSDDVYDVLYKKPLLYAQETVYLFIENIESKWSEYGADTDTSKVRFYVEMTDLFDGEGFNDKGFEIRNDASQYFTKHDSGVQTPSESSVTLSGTVERYEDGYGLRLDSLESIPDDYRGGTDNGIIELSGKQSQIDFSLYVGKHITIITVETNPFLPTRSGLRVEAAEIIEE
jgi:hypothetical protein